MLLTFKFDLTLGEVSDTAIGVGCTICVCCTAGTENRDRSHADDGTLIKRLGISCEYMSIRLCLVSLHMVRRVEAGGRPGS